MIFDVLFDGQNQILNVAEASPTDAFVSDFSEPSLDQIHPRARNRDKVQMKSRVSPKPRFHPGVLVGAVIVHDQMQIELGSLGIDLLEETDEFLMPLPLHSVANHLAVEHAQSGKQRGRAVAFVVMRHGCTPPLLQRKARLSSV